MTNSPDTGLRKADAVHGDLIPVPHAATVELGRDCDCPRKCKSCAFNETQLEKLTPAEILRSMDTLARYWDDVGKNPEFQLVGARFIEFLGIAGAMNGYAREDIGRFLAAGKRYGLQQIAFMCDAKLDERAIRDFYELHAVSEMPGKGVIALSVDELPVSDPEQGRKMKADASWKMLEKREQYLKAPERQNFRVFTTMSKSNLKDIPEIAEKVLAGGNLLFVAPITAHTPEALAGTIVTGRLLMGTDTSDLLTEEDAPLMETVVAKLRELKEKYPAQFLNGEANFENMIVACKPLLEAFRNNCRESCKFTLAGGEVLNCTPNIRIVKKPGDKDLSLAICTCFVGPTGNGENYADTPLSYLEDAGKDTEKQIALCRKLTRNLAGEQVNLDGSVEKKEPCRGCMCRTAVDIKKGGLK